MGCVWGGEGSKGIVDCSAKGLHVVDALGDPSDSG